MIVLINIIFSLRYIVSHKENVYLNLIRSIISTGNGVHEEVRC